jgi:NhaA family Na+:H+ antiporter
MPRLRKRIARRSSAVVEYLQTETTSGLGLLAATVAALVWANLSGGYEEFWHTSLDLGFIDTDLRHWINDGLMTLFFFVVGMEIKRELITGELNQPRVAALPMLAAVGGMAVPAAIYLAFNFGGKGAAGWGIPMATDIAFVLGLIALLGRRVPRGLRLFLLTLAIVDDVGAIVVIALFYSGGADWAWLLAAFGALALIFGLQALKVTNHIAYVLPAFAMWFATFQSGVHPTIAGVLLGLTIPARPFGGRVVMDRLETAVHPVSSFVVVPLFALANAGVIRSADTLSAAVGSPVFWGVVAGLVGGKTFGIVGAAVFSRFLKLGRLPNGVRMRDMAGGAALAGIGFTVSLFITGLAFTDELLVSEAKMGVLGGSVLSALVGAGVLIFRARGRS